LQFYLDLPQTELQAIRIWGSAIQLQSRDKCCSNARVELLSRHVVALRAPFRAAAIRLSLPMVSIHFQDAVW
jgi:hypothetical protein